MEAQPVRCFMHGLPARHRSVGWESRDRGPVRAASNRNLAGAELLDALAHVLGKLRGHAIGRSPALFEFETASRRPQANTCRADTPLSCGRLDQTSAE